jgi:hypothetical protein
MRRVFIIIACIGASILLLQSWAQGPQEKKGYPPYTPRLAVPGQPIAGIPFDEALKIYERHEEELRHLPGSISVSFYADGLVVETTNPKALPAVIEGLPVIPVPPAASRAAEGAEPQPFPLPDLPEVVDPTSRPCPPGSFRAPGEGRCRRTNPSVADPKDSPKPKLLPPPSGVIVLKPGKVREEAESCPTGFEEVEGYGGWRFCIDPQKPEPLPPLWSPPINGIPFEEALAILERHTPEFAKLPGIESVGLGADGIHIYTSNPEVVPKAVEGMPIIVYPATRGKIKLLSHTYNTPIRPLHGAVFILNHPDGPGVLTGVALSEGKPWLIFPAHLLIYGGSNSNCPLATIPQGPENTLPLAA